jgi:P27 family predicted phage terminase small subunit
MAQCAPKGQSNMRGRKPTPAALLKLKGTGNVTRMKARGKEPEADGELSAAPEWLSEGQAAGWAYAIDNAPKNVLRRIDRGVLAIWVEAEDRHRQATVMQAKLDQGNNLPFLVKGKDGVPAVSAYVHVITKAALIMMKAATELGFSPAARPRLAQKVGELAGKTSAWDRLKVINGGKGAA